MSNYPEHLLTSALAAEGDKTIPPATSQEAGTGRFSQNKGWTEVNSMPLAEGGIPPKRQDFNGAFYLLSQFILWFQQGGVMNYSAELDYEPNNEVFAGNVKYRCLKANGKSTKVVAPGSDPAYWATMDAGDVRWDKEQNLSTNDQARARKNIDVQSTAEVAAQLADAIKGFVAFDKAQSLSDEQKKQARTNIGAVQGSDISGFVSFTESQGLSAEQQATARKNISAAPVDSPAFTGTPTAPTPASSDSSTRVPTTEWVKRRIAAEAPEDYVVETYRSGSTWYRKWKSGFIQQHGKCGGGYPTITLPIAFKYPETVCVQVTATGGGHPDDCYTMGGINSDGKTIWANLRRFTGGDWLAEGF
jgi:hypothetical protein